MTVDGTPLRDRDHAVAQRVVFIPPDNGLASILTAAENVQVVLIAQGVSPADARRTTVDVPDRLGFAGQTDQLVERL